MAKPPIFQARERRTNSDDNHSTATARPANIRRFPGSAGVPARKAAPDLRPVHRRFPIRAPSIAASHTVIPAKAGIRTVEARFAIRNQV